MGQLRPYLQRSKVSSTAIDSRSEAFNRQCVLIVSRNAALIWRLRSLLPGLDHYTAETCGAAIGDLRAYEPSLAIIDMKSVLEAPELVVNIRREANGAVCRILLLSNTLQESLCIKALLSGADDYLHQPFADREFVDRSKLLLRLGETLARLAQLGSTRAVPAPAWNLDTEVDVRAAAVQTLTEITELLSVRAEESGDQDTKRLLCHVIDRAHKLAGLLDRSL
jgi:DNA-binding response OmpR family regulator